MRRKFPSEAPEIFKRLTFGVPVLSPSYVMAGRIPLINMPGKKRRLMTTLFGLIEIGIGFVTLVALISSSVLNKSAKPGEVFVFVLIASCLSAGLGTGVLCRNRLARSSLLFFASVIILSKILIFGGIITLNGALETTIPQSAKNAVSVVYHCLLIGYFCLPSTKKEFG